MHLPCVGAIWLPVDRHGVRYDLPHLHPLGHPRQGAIMSRHRHHWVYMALDGGVLPVFKRRCNCGVMQKWGASNHPPPKKESDERVEAPLYEALRLVVERQDAYGTLDTDDGQHDLENARAALAKAGGGGV